MKDFTVCYTQVSRCTKTIQADSLEEAWRLAKMSIPKNEELTNPEISFSVEETIPPKSGVTLRNMAVVQ